MRRLMIAVLLVGVWALALTAAAAAQVEPYGANDYGGFRDVLPPGTNGLVNGVELLGFEATKARPPHSDDQYAMYRDLGFALPIGAGDIQNYFKDSTFGVAPGQTGSSESPAPGVNILRDKAFGVPHIYGDTRAGLMFGIGYATAEDRLFFIDALRHAGRGELASFAGGSNTAMDASQWAVAPYTEADLQRQIDEAPARAQELQRLGAVPGVDVPAVVNQVYADAQSYVNGINAYITAARLNPLLMPAEYVALGRLAGPDPFKVTDLVSIAALVGGIFGQGGGGELAAAQRLQRFEQRFGARRGLAYWRDFEGRDDPETPTTVHRARFPYQLEPARVAKGSVAMPDRGSVVQSTVQTVTRAAAGARSATSVTSVMRALERIPAARSLLAFPRDSSNALVVSARKSATGHPLAVFGPQVSYFTPQILMEEDIHGPGVDAAGAAFPGVNLYVELGHGRDYAWSATSAGNDIIDTFALALCDPAGGAVTTNSSGYLFHGACVAMEKLQKTESWQPNLADSTPAGSETLTAYRTKLGLVIARATIRGRPVAYVQNRATYLHELDSAVGFALFNDPTFVHDARSFQLAANGVGYTFNWLYADSAHIAYFNSGENPVRRRGVDPRLPTSASFEWKNFDPNTNVARYTRFDQHPQVIDQDFITSWNNKQAQGYELGGTPVYRSQLLDNRIRDQLRGGRRMTLADLINAMEDAGTVDLRAQSVLPDALAVIGTPADPALAGAVGELRSWLADGAHRRSSALGQPYQHSDAIRIFDAWWPRLVQAIYGPAMGSPLIEPIDKDDLPHQRLGSAWDVNSYGYVQKDLRQVLHRHVALPFKRTWCGDGRLARCRAALDGALSRAAGMTAAQVYPADAHCSAGAQVCFDEIDFRAIGAVTQPLMQWINRPTFQQANSIQGHRAFPSRPGCIYLAYPIAATRSAVGARGRVALRGSATPRDCGVAGARITAVRVSVARRAGRRCRFVNGAGLLGRPRSCARPVLLRARGTRHWSLRAGRRLARGSYAVRAQALDANGDVAQAPARTFRVR